MTPAETPPPGSWGGDLAVDGLDRQYRMSQASRLASISTQEEARRQAAQKALADAEGDLDARVARVRAEAQRKLQEMEEQHAADLRKAGKQATTPEPGEREAIPQGDGTPDPWQHQQTPPEAFTGPRTAEGLAGTLAPPPGIRRRSPAFVAAQSIASMAVLRQLAEDGQVEPGAILDAIREAAELQYALVEALPAALSGAVETVANGKRGE